MPTQQSFLVMASQGPSSDSWLHQCQETRKKLSGWDSLSCGSMGTVSDPGSKCRSLTMVPNAHYSPSCLLLASLLPSSFSSLHLDSGCISMCVLRLTEAKKDNGCPRAGVTGSVGNKHS